MRMTAGSPYMNGNLRSPSIPVYRSGMPCPKHSPFEFRNAVAMEYRKNSFDLRNSFEIPRTSPSRDNASSSSSTSSRLNITLSTPSPSARADGGKLDQVIEKFRRLSEEWVRNREIEESENTVDDFLRSRSPSPSRSLRNYFRRSSSLSTDDTQNSRSTRSPSPQKSLPTSPLRSTSSPPKVPPLNRRPPGPPQTSRISPVRSTTPQQSYKRTNSYDGEVSSNYRSGSLPRDPAKITRSTTFRRSSSYDSDPPILSQTYYSLRSRSPSPISGIYKRRNSYDSEEKLRNFRSRSTSPQRLTPASSYYRRSNSGTYEDNDNYSPRLSSRSPSPSPQSVSLLKNIFRRSSSYEGNRPDPRDNNFNYKNVITDSYGSKFNTLPRSRSSPQRRSSLEDNPYLDNARRKKFNLNSFLNNDNTRKVVYSNEPKSFSGLKLNNRPSLPTRNSLEINNPFLPYTLPELPSYKMPTTQRRFSEEDSALRKPLETLHEVEGLNRRKYSNDIRRQSYDSDASDEYYRRLSEAGIRKLSDASVILNEDTDSFIIGDRVWVGGTKPGVISYIGETHFAPGDWAGITLDDAIGKNDGSVGGSRYFQCEAKKGVFSRLTRLSRNPLSDYDFEYLASKTSTLGSDSPKSYSTPTPSIASGPISSTPARRITPTSSQPPTTDPPRKITPQSSEPPRKISGSVGNGTQTFSKAGSPSPSTGGRKSSGPIPGDVKIGDRVIINSTTGVKWGMLRYVGETAFAAGVWGGVELEDPIGKNDGSVAGKKYFTCRQKYGLFAPLAKISRYPNSGGQPPRRPSATGISTTSRSIPTIRRSGSRESLGASSAASSTVSSSLKGPRRPSRTSTGSTSSTKALQDTLAEKTQHVEQLMRERDMERGEVARMATQTDEAVRVAHDLKNQLDQLQMESEERLHDLGQKVQELEADKKGLWAKIDDKQKEVDDLTFRLEEESLAKADFETQSITQSKQFKELKEKLEKEEAKGKTRDAKDADKACEMEEIEISLRASVEELQAKVMDLEQDKENFESKVEQLEEKLRSKETENASLSNSSIEKDQKINLLESTQKHEEVRSREKSEEVSFLEQKIKSLQLEVEKKAKDYQDISQQAEEFLDDLEKEKQCKENLAQDLAKSKEAESKIQLEVTRLTELSAEFEVKLKLSQEKELSLEEKLDGVESRLSASTDAANNSSNKLLNAQKKLEEKEEEISTLKNEIKEASEKAESLSKSIQRSEENVDSTSKQVESLTDKVSLLEADKKSKEEELNEKSLSISDLNRQISDSQKKIDEMEELRKRLESQLESAMSNSTSSSDQLKTLNQQLREAESKLASSQEVEWSVSAELAKEKEIHESNRTTFEKEIKELKDKFDQDMLSMKEDSAKLQQKSLEDLNEKEAKIKQLISEREELNNKHSEELKTQSEKLKIHEADNADLADELNKLQSDLDKIKKDTESSSANDASKIESLEVDKSKLVQQNDDSQLKIDELCKILGQKDEDIASLKKVQDSHSAFVAQKEQIILTLNSEVEIMQKQLSSYREELERQVLQAKADQNEMSILKNSLDGEHKNLLELEADLELNKAEHGKLLEEKSKLLEQVKKVKELEKEKSNLIDAKNNLENDLKQSEELNKNHEKLISERDKLLKQVNTITPLQEENSKAQEKISQLQERLQKSLKCEEELNSVKEQKQKLETELKTASELKTQLANSSSECGKAKEENVALKTQLATLEESVKQMSELEITHSKLQASFASLQKETQLLTSKLESKDQELASFKKLEGDHSQSLGIISDLQKEKLVLEEKSIKLQSKLQEEHVASEKQKEEMKLQIAQLQKSLEEHKVSSKETIENLETEKRNLIEEVVSFDKEASLLRDKLQSSSLSLQKLQSKESEESESAHLRLRLITAESDKRKLQEEIKEIRDSLAIYQGGNTKENEFVMSLKSERDQLEGQVNFLNSVIVEMQKNKEELLAKIEALHSGTAFAQETSDLNGVSERRVAPRMFCDICDCFDLHDTDDCPKQASTEDSPPPSMHHGMRDAAPRPYCDSCEVFGHTDGECPEETF